MGDVLGVSVGRMPRGRICCTLSIPLHREVLPRARDPEQPAAAAVSATATDAIRYALA